MSKQNQIIVTLKSFTDCGEDINLSFEYQLANNVKKNLSFCVSKLKNLSLIENVADILVLSLSLAASEKIHSGFYTNWIQKKGGLYMIKNMFNLIIINTINELNYRELNDVLSNLIMPAGEFKLIQAAA